MAVDFNFQPRTFVQGTLLVFAITFMITLILLLTFPPSGVEAQIDSTTLPSNGQDCSKVKCVPCVCVGQVTFWSLISGLCFLGGAYALALFFMPMARLMGFTL